MSTRLSTQQAWRPAPRLVGTAAGHAPRAQMTNDEALEALAKYRDEIDALDLQLLDLLNRRTKVVEEIGEVKQAVNLPVYEPKREEDVFRNVIENNTGPLTTDALKRIFERIIDEMRSLQRMRRQGEK